MKQLLTLEFSQHYDMSLLVIALTFIVDLAIKLVFAIFVNEKRGMQRIEKGPIFATFVRLFDKINNSMSFSILILCYPNCPFIDSLNIEQSFCYYFWVWVKSHCHLTGRTETIFI